MADHGNHLQIDDQEAPCLIGQEGSQKQREACGLGGVEPIGGIHGSYSGMSDQPGRMRAL